MDVLTESAAPDSRVPLLGGHLSAEEFGEHARLIGFEFASLGLSLPDDCPRGVREGFAEGRHRTSGQRRPTCSPYARKLVRLRLSALKRDRSLDPHVPP